MNSGIKSVRVDTGLSAGDVVALGRTFRSFNPDELKTVQLPVYGTWLGAAAVVLPKMPEAEAVLAQFRNVETTGDEAVRAVSVNVQNGTGRYNEATKVSDTLGAVGFITGPPGDNLGTTGEASIIGYHAGQEAQARLLARHLKSDVTFELTTTSGDGATAEPLTLITGTSYAGVLMRAKAAAGTPGPSTTTSTTTTPPGTSLARGIVDNRSWRPPTTTSTVPGYLPGPPPPGVHCG